MIFTRQIKGSLILMVLITLVILSSALLFLLHQSLHYRNQVELSYGYHKTTFLALSALDLAIANYDELPEIVLGTKNTKDSLYAQLGLMAPLNLPVDGKVYAARSAGTIYVVAVCGNYKTAFSASGPNFLSFKRCE